MKWIGNTSRHNILSPESINFRPDTLHAGGASAQKIEKLMERSKHSSPLSVRWLACLMIAGGLLASVALSGCGKQNRQPEKQNANIPEVDIPQIDAAKVERIKELVESGWGVAVQRGNIVGVCTPTSGKDERFENASSMFGQVESVQTNVEMIHHIGTKLFVSHLPSLRTLDVDYTWNTALTTTDYWTLLALPHLQELKIGKLKSSDDKPEHAQGSLLLKKLDLQLGEQVSVPPLIKDFPLEVLRIHGSADHHFDESTLQAIGKLPNLKRLKLSVPHRSYSQNIDLSPLFDIPELSHLELQRVILNPAQLQQLRHLKHLRLCDCRFTTEPKGALFGHQTLEGIILELQPMDKLKISQKITEVGNQLETIELLLPRTRDLPLFADTSCDLSLILGNQSPSIRICYDLDSFADDHFTRRIDISMVKVLSSWTGLKKLHLKRLWYSGIVEITDTVLAKLIESTHFTSLVLRSNLTHSLQLLSEVDGGELESLSFDFTSPLKKGEKIPHLKPFRKLKSLELIYLGDDDFSTKMSASLYSPSLRRLRIIEGYIPVGEIQKLMTASPNLEEVEFVDCYFEEEEKLLLLNKLANLKQVSILDCEISADIVLQLHAETIRIGNRDILETGAWRD